MYHTADQKSILFLENSKIINKEKARGYALYEMWF